MIDSLFKNIKEYTET